jgi:hypothetical protein
MRSTLLGVVAEFVEVDDTMNARCLRLALGPGKLSVFQVCNGTCQTAPLFCSVIVWPCGARMTPVW